MNRTPATHLPARSCRPYSLFKSQTNLKVARDLWANAVGEFVMCPTSGDGVTADDLALAAFVLFPLSRLPARSGEQAAAAAMARNALDCIEGACVRPDQAQRLVEQLESIAQVGPLCHSLTYREGFLSQFQRAAEQAVRVRRLYEAQAATFC